MILKLNSTVAIVTNTTFKHRLTDKLHALISVLLFFNYYFVDVSANSLHCTFSLKSLS